MHALEIDLAIVASHADAAGVPFGDVRARLQVFDAAMLPLVEAALTFDPARMRGALVQVETQYQKQAEVLARSLRAIGKNAQLSAKVIQFANVLTLAMALYDVSRSPVVRGSGGLGTSEPPPAPVFSIAGISGGAAVMGRGIDVRALAAAADAVRKLVAIGALDAAVITGIAKLGGGAGTIAELQKPSLLWSEGGSQAGGGKSEEAARLGARDKTSKTHARRENGTVKESPAESVVVFTARGAGSSLVRTAVVGRARFQINTGHGFHRTHTGPDGRVTDLRTTGLTPDVIETAIIQDVNTFRARGGSLARPGTAGFAGPTERTVTVGGYSIGYRAVETAPYQLGIGTYFLK